MASQRELQPGDTLQGRYEIMETLGVGGFGRVVKARHIAMDRIVAIKLLRLASVGDARLQETMRRRFLQEAQIISRLHHPNTVQVHDFGIDEGDDGGDSSMFMVVEYIEGRALDELLGVSGRLPVQAVIHVLRQALGSLDEAHGLGVVHRDVKPANIMITERLGDPWFVKVLDFGIAAPMTTPDAPTAEGLTLTGSIIGTPGHMSPEQLCAQPVTAASDIYCLGLVAFELLVGDPAFTSEVTAPSLSNQVYGPDIRLPADLDICDVLRAAVDGALRKDLDARLRDARAFLDALEGADAAPRSAASVERGAAPTEEVDAALIAAADQPAEPLKPDALGPQDAAALGHQGADALGPMGVDTLGPTGADALGPMGADTPPAAQRPAAEVAGSLTPPQADGEAVTIPLASMPVEPVAVEPAVDSPGGVADRGPERAARDTKREVRPEPLDSTSRPQTLPQSPPAAPQPPPGGLGAVIGVGVVIAAALALGLIWVASGEGVGDEGGWPDEGRGGAARSGGGAEGVEAGGGVDEAGRGRVGVGVEGGAQADRAALDALYAAHRDPLPPLACRATSAGAVALLVGMARELERGRPMADRPSDLAALTSALAAPPEVAGLPEVIAWRARARLFTGGGTGRGRGRGRGGAGGLSGDGPGAKDQG